VVEMENTKRSGYLAKILFNIVPLPTPLGPETTTKPPKVEAGAGAVGSMGCAGSTTGAGKAVSDSEGVIGSKTLICQRVFIDDKAVRDGFRLNCRQNHMTGVGNNHGSGASSIGGIH